MRLPTFSSVARAMACPTSCALPQADHVSERQERGTAIHAFLAAVGKVGREEALLAAPDEYRATCEAIRLEELPACDPEAWASEVSFAYNVDTGEARELGRNLDRSYPWGLDGRWIFGTVDVVGLAQDPSTLVVVDYKGSRWTPAERAERNWQLRAGALAACRVYGRLRAAVAIVKLDDFGEAHWDRATFDAFDLDQAGADLQELADRIEVEEAALGEGKPPQWLATGSHCDWCPALAWCPAHLGLARAFAADPAKVEGEARALLTPENAPAARQRVKELKRILEAVEEGLKAFARQTPFMVGPGTVYGPKPRVEEQLVGEVVRTAFATAFDEEFAKDATEVDAPKKALDLAVKRWKSRKGDPRTLKAITEAAMEAARKAGGTRKSTTYVVTEHKVAEGKAA